MAVLVCSCGRAQPSRHATQQALRDETRQKAIDLIAKQFDADFAWRQAFTNGDHERTYTFELQKQLIRADHRPVVLIGVVDDVIATDDAQYELRGHDLSAQDPDIYFSLVCDPKHVDVAPVLAKAHDFFDEFAFVVQVDRLSSPMLKARAQTEEENGDRGLVVEPADQVIVIGRCVSVVHLDSTEGPK